MKHLILVNGTMGVGKTAVCTHLLDLLQPGVFLDGDWCWNMKPFVVNDETKAMVMDNIAHQLGNFLGCSAYEYVIFCWVMHREQILRELLRRLPTEDCQVHLFTLTATPEALRRRLDRDIQKGLRTPDVVLRSLQRMEFYREMDTIKLDVSRITALEAAEEICRRVMEGEPEDPSAPEET